MGPELVDGTPEYQAECAEHEAWRAGNGPEPDWAGRGFSTPYADPELESEQQAEAG